MYEQDYDRIRDRELNANLDKKYPIHYEDVEDASREALLVRAIDWIEGMKDQPYEDTLYGVKEEFGLTYKEVETVIHRWILK